MTAARALEVLEEATKAFRLVVEAEATCDPLAIQKAQKYAYRLAVATETCMEQFVESPWT